MTDYDYTHWAEMASRYGLQESKGGLRIMKVPTNTVKENAENLEMKCFGNALYQVVKTQANDWDNYYNMGSYSNTQWHDKQPYFLDPMKSMTNRKQYHPRQQPQGQYVNPFAPNPTPCLITHPILQRFMPFRSAEIISNPYHSQLLSKLPP